MDKDGTCETIPPSRHTSAGIETIGARGKERMTTATVDNDLIEMLCARMQLLEFPSSRMRLDFILFFFLLTYVGGGGRGRGRDGTCDCLFYTRY